MEFIIFYVRVIQNIYTPFLFESSLINKIRKLKLGFLL